MKRLAILTSLNMPQLMAYDIDIINILNETEGIKAEPIIWETGYENLQQFDVAIFRTTWGYHEKPQQFSEFLNFLEEIKIPTLNPLHIIKSNFHKFYLQELSETGIDIIPTEFIPRNSGINLKELILKQSWEKFVIKPAISAGSHRTYVCLKYNIDSLEELFANLNITDDILIQKYLPEVESAGEFSTIYFHGGYHFAVNKIPKLGDYRVQFNYGGDYKLVQPNEIISQTSAKIASLFLDECLYVRVDGLFSEGKFLLMEVEMLEPDLYMNIHPEAKEEFVKSILSLI